MDKPLTGKDKNDNATEQKPSASTAPAAGKDVPVSAQTAPQPSAADPKSPDNDQPMGAYGAQTTRPLITKKEWEKASDHRPWMDDPKTRLGIRMFSRGILGAAFFAGGGLLARKLMQKSMQNGVTLHEAYDATKGFSQQANPLQFIAKLIDTTVGKPIEAAVTNIAGKEAGLQSVRFRPTSQGRWGLPKEMRGRSLGDEVVNITFDFFCASVGDALGRDIAGWFDPNVKKTWTDEKGNIKFPEALKSTLSSVARYVTYNGGEDWAVAIPYAYFMKGQRALINRASPGFKYDFDRNINGGSFKINNNKIVGNYNLEGLLDLQSRFTVYNIGTLMFREAYDYVGNTIAGKPDSLYGAPDKEEHKGILGKASNLIKWAARSVIKGTIIMTPAVPLFWITRTPQSKHRGAFIDPEKGVLVTDNNNRPITLYANTEPLNPSQQLKYKEYRFDTTPNAHGHYDGMHSTSTITAGEFLPGLTQSHPGGQGKTNFNAYNTTHGIVDHGLNAIGKANYRAASLLDKPAAWADNHWGTFGTGVKDTLGIRKYQDFTRPMLYASASYTPYMYAKAEFANLWDNGKMDMATERLVDGAANFNWGEFKAGVSEVWNSVLHKTLDDPEREAEAQRRNEIDTHPHDIFTKTQAGMKEEAEQAQVEAEKKKQKNDLSWRERMISAKTPEKKPAPAKEAPAKTHADQEALRKALEESTPPTNAIN